MLRIYTEGCYGPDPPHSCYIALQDMQTFKNQAKIMLPFLVTLLLIKVSNCAKYMLYMKMTASALQKVSNQRHRNFDSELYGFEKVMKII